MQKIDPYKYTEQDKNKLLAYPHFAGVYNKEGRQYASDRTILFRNLVSNYPKKHEGKLIGKDGEVVKKFLPDGRKSDDDAMIVNYEKVIPSEKTIGNEYREYIVSVDSLEDVAKKASGKIRKIELFDKKVSFIDKNTGEEIGTFNPKYIRKVVDFMRLIGTDRILFHRELLSRPLIVDDGIHTLMLMPIIDHDKGEIRLSITPSEKPSTKVKKVKSEKKPTAMTRKRTTAKAHGSSTTMRDASRILKAQKDDYQKIFRAEVKKSKDPKAGAKKAGKIYRDRYGATATARWKKALKRAK